MYLVDKWFREQIEGIATDWVAYGAMMHDLLPQSFGLPGSSEETATAKLIADDIIARLVQSRESGEIAQLQWPS